MCICTSAWEELMSVCVGVFLVPGFFGSYIIRKSDKAYFYFFPESETLSLLRKSPISFEFTHAYFLQNSWQKRGEKTQSIFTDLFVARVRGAKIDKKQNLKKIKNKKIKKVTKNKI